MEYNFLTNIENCYYGISSLIYYSHIPTAIAALILGLFVYFKDRKSLAGKILLSLSLVFSLWCVFNLILWINPNSLIIMTIWSYFGILDPLIFLLSLYFVYVFINKRDPNVNSKFFWVLLALPLILLNYVNSGNFDLVNCQATQTPWYILYYYGFELLVAVYILVYVFIKYHTAEKIFKPQIVLMTVGIELFLFSFFFSGFLASYLVEQGFVNDFGLEQYGLFGLTFFIGFLAFLIVRFKAFDIKLIGAQALVWTLIILVGSQFFFIQNNTNKVLTAITLVISAIVGLIIVRSVKKEVSLRESLEIANKGQENLIHIMNHQIKGFLGTARSIFAELLQSNDYGQMPEESKPLLNKGFESTTAGVNYVTDILRGANASKGTLAFNMEPMDTKVIVDELLIEMQSLAKEWNVVLEGNVNPGDYQINGDRTQLKESFKNLITNAIRYNDPDYDHKSVKVSLSRTGNNILFSVRDTGKGISPEDAARLFTPGGVGKNSLKQNSDATGFGLSFVKGTAVAHNGRVDYYSNKPAKGTTFFIELPVAKSVKTS